MRYLLRWSNGVNDAEVFTAGSMAEFSENSRDAALSLMARGKSKYKTIELQFHGNSKLSMRSVWRNVYDSRNRNRFWALLDLSKGIGEKNLEHVWRDILISDKNEIEFVKFMKSIGDNVIREIKKMDNKNENY